MSPRPVSRPVSGRSRAGAVRNSFSAGVGRRIQPTIRSGASTYISTDAGGPATNTRLTRSGRLILRFAESTIVRP